MWVETMILNNVRSFKSYKFTFSRGVNLLVGANNSGKSSVLLPILMLQDQLPSLQASDSRIGSSEGEAILSFGGDASAFFGAGCRDIHIRLLRRKDAVRVEARYMASGQASHAQQKIPSYEPKNVIYPFLSKRKVVELSERINAKAVVAVQPNLANLNAKIDRLSNPQFLPPHDLYVKACRDILGFTVTTAHSPNGKRAAYIVRNQDSIPLQSMGEGVVNILGLVVDLAMAKGHIFVLEEPENDIHPAALKGLLSLIAEKAGDNQFLITTHSNIVLRELGALPDTKVFKMTLDFQERIPTTIVTEIGTEQEERRALLQELGYALSDFDLWDGWLFLEESSAEKIIREYLIPWFCSSLSGKLCTFSAHSLSEVIPKLRDFKNLLVYLNLSPVYKNRAWVLVDGGDEEAKILDQLRETYKKGGWTADRFMQLSEHDFEQYYPEKFADRVESVLAVEDRKVRRAEKRTLLAEVEAWIQNDADAAKAAFEKSCDGVISLLRKIESALNAPER